MPSINMLLPRETISATRPQPIAAAKDSPTSTRQATLPKGRIDRPKPAINRPERIARRMRNARVKRARAKFAGIFQRQFRRQRQQIDGPDDAKR